MEHREPGPIRRSLQGGSKLHPMPGKGRWRMPHWLTGFNVMFLLGGSFVFAVIYLLVHAFGALASVRSALTMFACLWLFGVFVVITVMTDENKGWSGGWARTLTGAAAAAGIALVLAASWDIVGIAALAGALAGSLALGWVKYL